MSRLRTLFHEFQRHSIRAKLMISFIAMLVGTTVVTLTSVTTTRGFLQDYHDIANRVASANRLIPITRDTIETEAYYLVAGRETVQTTTLYDYVTDVEQTLQTLYNENSADGGKRYIQLRIARRTLGTLERYCARLWQECEAEAPVEQQNQTLEQIRTVSDLVCEQINEYIYLELAYMEDLDQQIQIRSDAILLGNLTVLAAVLFIITLVHLLTDRGLIAPIQTLVDSTRRLSEGDFDICVETRGQNELTVLNENFNRMAEKLHLLMNRIQEDTRTREQLELRLMQEQINPHFLYNTLEIVVWLAESGDKEQVIKVVQSLSRFFRIVLSSGREVITIKEELDCIQSYLYIQQMRYSDILRYEITADEETLGCPIQKLTLQPLVENALYHGIEKKRGGGVIGVRVERDGDVVRMTVSDNGCGMDSETLSRLRRSISDDAISEAGFGLSNLQKRIQLAYGPAYKVRVDSREGEGTRVTVCIPAEPQKN